MPVNNLIEGTNYCGDELLRSPNWPPIYRKNILEAVQARLRYMVMRYRKVVVFRLDLRLPCQGVCWEEPNGIFSRFVEHFAENLRERCNFQFLWVREQTLWAPHPHFHFLIIADGDRVPKPFAAMLLATEHWRRALHIPDARGLVHLASEKEEDIQGEALFDAYSSNLHYWGRPERTRPKVIKIHQDDPDAGTLLQETVRWCSYLAKDHSKGRKPLNVRTLGYSVIPTPP